MLLYLMKMLANTLPLLLLPGIIQSAKIFGFFMIPSISHQVVYQPIWRELALRGHQVTIISTDILRENITNLREIDVGCAYDYFTTYDVSKKIDKDKTIIQITHNFLEMLGDFTESEFQHPEVLELIKDNRAEFDVVLVEAFSPLVYAFGGKYKVPVVGIASAGVFLDGHDAVGNPTHPVISPDILLNLKGGMTFYNRLKSFFYNIYFRVIYEWYWLPRYDKMARKYFGNDIPYLGDLERNVSLLLLNVNPLMHAIRPNVPAIVEISQMHIKPKKPLPDDIKKFLDDSKEGAIYFSLGSNVKSANLPQETLEVIKKGLGELPYRILWKWESDVLPGKPGNVMTRKWLPQQDVLGHPNIRAFVTQGGIQSVEEAISNGVPMIGVPFIGDQSINVEKLANMGIARGVDATTLTVDILKEAILDVAQNQTYKEKILEVRSLLTDQPMVGVEKAVWWIEYVIRHKGAKHLVSPAKDMPLWKYFCLDVMGFIFAVVLILVYCIAKIVSRIFSKPSAITKYKTS